MIVNTGRNEIRDKLKELITDMKMGTDSTSPSETDTDLGSSVYSSSSSDSDGSIGESKHQIRLTTADGNGNTLREIGTFDVDGDMISRSVHAGIDKDSSFELLVEVKMEVQT